MTQPIDMSFLIDALEDEGIKSTTAAVCAKET